MRDAPPPRRTTLRALPLALALSACELVIGLEGERTELEAQGGEGNASMTAGGTGAGSGSGPTGGRAGSAGSAGDTSMGGASEGGSVGEGSAGDAGTSAGDAGTGANGGHSHEGGRGGDAGNSETGGAGGEGVAGGDGGVPSEGGRPGAEVGVELTSPSCVDRNPVECEDVNPCLTIDLPGGTFPMGRSTNGSDRFDTGAAQELPEHDVTLDAFRLDKHEVTVGRFRRFVEAYTGTSPAQDVGRHPAVLGSGWQTDWNAFLPSSQSDLRALLTSRDTAWDELGTWTEAAGDNECLPMNFIDWYLAFAFCIWDGGRLPSEAEWEYAAAGAGENRLYPWGDRAPTDRHAVFRCGATGTPACEVGDIAAVGSRRSRGDGRFGHSDLGGSMAEFVRDRYQHDFYETQPANVPNPMNLGFDIGNAPYVTRGGDFVGEGPLLRGASRTSAARTGRYVGLGVRCARQP